MAFIFEGLAPEVIETLTAGAQRALPYVVHAVTAGLSANAIGRALEEAGMGVRRASLLSVVRAVRETIVGAEVQRGLEGDTLPSPSLFQGSLTFMRRPYAYVVEVNGINTLTGKRTKRHITVSSGSILSNDMLEQYVGDIVEAAGGESTAALEMQDFTVTQVLVDQRILP